MAKEITDKKVSNQRATLRSGHSSSTSEGPAKSTTEGATSILGKLVRTALVATYDSSLALFYEPLHTNVMSATVCHVSDDNEEEVDQDTEEQAMFIDAAMYGDPIVSHCLASGATISPEST